jgi:hypothetical protein
VSRKLVLRTLLVLVVLVGVQLIPVDRSNPPVGAELQASGELKAVLQRCCYNCHSNQTHWPWYSRLAPVSWFISHDVHEARGKMNLSHWGELAAAQQEMLAALAWREVEGNEMPPRGYLLLHSDAKPGDRDKNTIREWSTSLGPGAK